MRLACLFVACAFLLAPVAARAADGGGRRRRRRRPRSEEGEQEEAGRRTKTATRPTKAARDAASGRADRQRRPRDQRGRARDAVPELRAAREEGARAEPPRSARSTPSRPRAPTRQPDRWWTVLFHLRELDSRNDPEACFWRVVAYYRLGELARARALRGMCEPPPAVQAVLDNEDAMSIDAAAGRGAARDGRRRREAARAGREPGSLRRPGVRHDDGAGREVTPAADPRADRVGTGGLRSRASPIRTTRGRRAAGPLRRIP